MQPTTLSPYRPPLAAPLALESQRSALAGELESYLDPLTTYCDRQEADDNLSEADFRHVFALRQFLLALGRYDANAEELLNYYREGLRAARAQATAHLPSLEQALGLPNADPSDYDSEPLYRLGWVRGFRKAQGQYEHLASLYAQYAILVPPPSYQPLALTQRLTAYLTSPEAQQYGGLPLTTRQALNTLTLPAPTPDAESEQIAA